MSYPHNSKSLRVASLPNSLITNHYALKINNIFSHFQQRIIMMLQGKIAVATESKAPAASAEFLIELHYETAEQSAEQNFAPPRKPNKSTVYGR